MVNKIEISTVSKTIDEIDDYRNNEVDLDHALNVAGKTPNRFKKRSFVPNIVDIAQLVLPVT